jgi:hypothetical protein
MIEAQVAGALAQFGVAGLVAWMWLSERRGASQREREATEAHRRLMDERSALEAVLETVRSNTRALTALEVVQRELMAALRGKSRETD